jgi:hypothetical protein
MAIDPICGMTVDEAEIEPAGKVAHVKQLRAAGKLLFTQGQPD